jgi:hypothetical protein
VLAGFGWQLHWAQVRRRARGDRAAGARQRSRIDPFVWWPTREAGPGRDGTHRWGARRVVGGCQVLEMSPPPSGSKASARGGTTRLRPTVMAVTKEDSMNKTLPEFGALRAAEHIADLRREATAERKARAARAARRQRRA